MALPATTVNENFIFVLKIIENIRQIKSNINVKSFVGFLQILYLLKR